MQDTALFCRHVAMGCFHRRRTHPVRLLEWQHEVEDARRFIGKCRRIRLSQPGYGRSALPSEIVRTDFALGPHVKTQQPMVFLRLPVPGGVPSLLGLLLRLTPAWC